MAAYSFKDCDTTACFFHTRSRGLSVSSSTLSPNLCRNQNSACISSLLNLVESVTPCHYHLFKLPKLCEFSKNARHNCAVWDKYVISQGGQTDITPSINLFKEKGFSFISFIGILSLCEYPWKRKKKKWNKINILTVKLPWSALFPLCLIMWSLAKSQLLLHPWQIDTDDINNIITSVTICEINHNMKTSNHLSWILQACILLRTVGEKMHLTKWENIKTQRSSRYIFLFCSCTFSMRVLRLNQ